MFICSTSFAFEHRLDKNGYERISEMMPTIERAAHEYKLPVWMITGIVYNESNARDVMGDSGRAYGLGQIHCGPGGFSWLEFLHDYGFRDCDDLMVDDQNIIAISIILKHLKQRSNGDPLILLTLYHKGNKKRKARGYYSRVRWFGTQIIKRHKGVCI